jgi:hypothetical protein
VFQDSKKGLGQLKRFLRRKKVEGKNGINGTAIAHSGEPALHTLPKPMDACERCKIQQFFTIASSGSEKSISKRKIKAHKPVTRKS